MYRPPNYSEEQWLAYKQAVAQPERTWALEMVMDLDDGTRLELTEKDVVAGSLIMKEQSTCSEGIMVGSTYANSLDFSLINGDGRFRNYNFMKARVHVTVRLAVPASESWAPVRLGTFIVLEAGKKYSTIPIRCMDAMCLFNRPLSDVQPVFPIQLKTLFIHVCQLVEVTYSSALYEQLPELMLGAFEVDKLTCRDFLSYVGCLIGRNLRMSRSGQLEDFWYAEVDYETTPDTRVSITVEDLSIHPTAVIIRDWSGTEYGPEDPDITCRIEMDTNPLIQNETMAAAVRNRLNALLTAVQYRVYDCQFIGDPTVQAGDILLHRSVTNQYETEAAVTAYVMAHEYRFRSSGRMAALGQAPEQDRQLTAGAKKILEVQNKAAKDLNEGLTSAQQTMLQHTNLLTESLALYGGVKYDAQGRLCSYYMASEPIFDTQDSDNGMGRIAPDDSNVDPRTDCYVWTYSGGGIGVSDGGYFGTYSGMTKDKSIVARTITADWIRTGVLSALDNSLHIDLESGEETIKAADGWGKTVLDGIGQLFKYWNKNVIDSSEDGHPPIAYLRITADADEQASTESYTAADLKLVWASYDGSMHTSVGHTVVHAANGSTAGSFGPFEVRSRGPIHIAPSLYYDESLLFDHITMRRTNLVPGNTGVDFLVTPRAIPIVPIMDGQVNQMENPGFESGSMALWNPSSGWSINSDPSYVHSGTYSMQCLGTFSSYALLSADALTQMGFYSHPVYVGFWLKAKGNNSSNPLYLRSGPNITAAEATIHIKAVSDGKDWVYASAIIPPLPEGHFLNLASSCEYSYVVDDFYVYNAQNYTLEQWDDYVARGAQ